MAVRLERLKIHKFRDVVPGTELRFSHGWNVVLGRNATGKTTLLHLISMALRGDFTALRGEEFDLEYELSNGEASLKVRLKSERRVEHVPSAFRRGTGDGREPQESAVLAIRERRAAAASVTLRAIVAAGADVEHFATSNVGSGAARGTSTSTSDGPSDDQALDVSTWLDDAQPSSNAARACRATEACRFDEGIELFRNLRGLPSEALGLPGVESSVVLYARLTIVTTPVEVAHAKWTSDSPNVSATTWHQTFRNCANLSKAAALLDGAELLCTYPVTNNEAVGAGRLMRLGPPTILLRRHDDSSISVDQLSFGQKRLFTFAWYLDANPDVVVADELVNGMHYEWIDDCARAMEGRQVFVTAQNPLLLDHVTISSPEDVTRSFVLCGATRTDATHREVRWTHPSTEQAAEFFRAYENGVLQVHEILRTEGLW